jgi:hypothetical protein
LSTHLRHVWRAPMAKHLDVEHQVEPEDGDQEAGAGGDDL